MWYTPTSFPSEMNAAELYMSSFLSTNPTTAAIPFDAAVWEDEKYSYVAVSRQPVQAAGARVIARPRKASGRVTLKLCCPDGSVAEQLFSRREGDVYKRAARSDWGSSL